MHGCEILMRQRVFSKVRRKLDEEEQEEKGKSKRSRRRRKMKRRCRRMRGDSALREPKVPTNIQFQ